MSLWLIGEFFSFFFLLCFVNFKVLKIIRDNFYVGVYETDLRQRRFVTDVTVIKNLLFYGFCKCFENFNGLLNKFYLFEI